MNVAEPPSAPGTQKIPPKLQQLLALMPDVDKVNLLHIARHYSMDLDDPGFLPLLLTQQGIKSLADARKSLSDECEKSASLIVSRSTAAIYEHGEAEKLSLTRLREESEKHIQETAADSEKALHEALAIWADETLHNSIASALVDNSKDATDEAQRIAISAASGFERIANEAAKASRQAAISCDEASKSMARTQPIFIALIFAIGVLVGAVGLLFAKPPKSDVHLDSSAVAKQVVMECRKNTK